MFGGLIFIVPTVPGTFSFSRLTERRSDYGSEGTVCEKSFVESNGMVVHLCGCKVSNGTNKHRYAFFAQQLKHALPAFNAAPDNGPSKPTP